jgi:hypothetical protein
MSPGLSRVDLNLNINLDLLDHGWTSGTAFDKLAVS